MKYYTLDVVIPKCPAQAQNYNDGVDNFSIYDQHLIFCNDINCHQLM